MKVTKIYFTFFNILLWIFIDLCFVNSIWDLRFSWQWVWTLWLLEYLPPDCENLKWSTVYHHTSFISTAAIIKLITYVELKLMWLYTVIIYFWDMSLCTSVNRYEHHIGIFWLHHPGKRHDIYLKNICVISQKTIILFSNSILQIMGLNAPHVKMLHAKLSVNFSIWIQIVHFLLFSTKQNCIQSTVQKQYTEDIDTCRGSKGYQHQTLAQQESHDIY